MEEIFSHFSTITWKKKNKLKNYNGGTTDKEEWKT